MTEYQLQTTVMEWINCYPKIAPYVIHIPNEGKRPLHTGARLKKMGMRAGVSDIFIALARHGYHGGFFELKTVKGTLTTNQLNFLKKMREAQYYATATYGLDDTIAILKWYLFEGKRVVN